MTTPLQRRASSVKRVPRGSLNTSPDLVWLYVVLGVGVFLGLTISVVVFACDFATPLPRNQIASRATQAITFARPGPNTVVKTAPVSDLSTSVKKTPAEAKSVVPPTSIGGAEIRPTESPQIEPPAVTNLGLPDLPRKVFSEIEYFGQLRDVPEFGLNPSVRDALVETYKTHYQSNAALGRKPMLDPSILMKHVSGVRDFSIRTYPGCQVHPASAIIRGTMGRLLHAYLDVLAPKDANGKRSDPKRLRAALRQERRGKRPEWLRPDALPAMVQILMAEEVPLRLILVDMIADIPGKEASIRLAQRAIYDLSLDVRNAAIEALRERPVREARRTFVDAMRYPWSAAAEHAAIALVALDDRDAVPLLVAHLDKPDPTMPFTTKTGASIREVVRVNHVRNCLLCHVPAVGRDPMTDVDPFARRPEQTYQVGSYSGPKIPGASGTGSWTNKVLIRADVQFLRQDFSITFPARESFGADGGQRFDFLVRTRPLKPKEVEVWKQRTKPDATEYPQRESVLMALRNLTGQDVGPTTAAWMKLYPHARAEAEGVRLANSLRAALIGQREQLLAKYRDAKEEHYTEWLGHAIPHVTGKLQETVRTALVDRLIQLPVDELRRHLEGDGELRLAAARACVRKADAQLVPELIELLNDANLAIREAAHQALRRLSGEDFGPPNDCAPEEREAAASKWREWHHRQGR